MLSQQIKSLLNIRKAELHVYPNAQGDESECMRSHSQCETQYLLLEWKIPIRSIQEMHHIVIVLKYILWNLAQKNPKPKNRKLHTEKDENRIKSPQFFLWQLRTSLGPSKMHLLPLKCHAQERPVNSFKTWVEHFDKIYQEKLEGIFYFLSI